MTVVETQDLAALLPSSNEPNNGFANPQPSEIKQFRFFDQGCRPGIPFFAANATAGESNPCHERMLVLALVRRSFFDGLRNANCRKNQIKINE
jgi:hypothetical protein